MNISSKDFTYDYLNGLEHIHLYQHKKMFRMNTDTCLLGNFIKVPEHSSVLDIGTNNGVLLLYASRFNVQELIGIDINQEALDIAKYNLEMNHIFNFKLHHCSFENYDSSNPIDIIICNPPYFQNALLSENHYLKNAKHEIDFSLSSLFNKVYTLLADHGKFYLVHRPERLENLLKELQHQQLYVKHLQKVYCKGKCVTILLEIQKNKIEMHISIKTI